jgi:DNA-binding NtrC family response regulator
MIMLAAPAETIDNGLPYETSIHPWAGRLPTGRTPCPASPCKLRGEARRAGRPPKRGMGMTDVLPNAAGHPTDRLIGTAPAIEALRTQIRHLATFDTLGSPLVPTLLLQGETGTGKGLVARVIHDSGPRAAGPFVDVNCAAIPETMLEAELFGFEAGAFTDAKRAKPGLFEAASRGSLFLDEVDALPLALQSKLLTALESKQVRRLGAVAGRLIDVKLIAATNAVLPQQVAAGRFRADLYHRLAVVVLALPPVRTRGRDVLMLAQAFLQQYAAMHGVPPKRLSAGAEAWLQRYAWPGNVRELIHVMERVTLLHVGEEVDAKTLTQLCLPLTLPAASTEAAPAPQEESARALPMEAAQIRQALAQTGGNVARAARLLGVSRDVVRYRMQRYGITRLRPAALPAPEATGPAPFAPLSFHPSPDVSAPGSPSLPLDERGREGPSTTPIPLRPSRPLRRRQGKEPQGAVVGQDIGREAPAERHAFASSAVWEHKPVAVLALEVTWPEVSGLEPFHYDPWTTAARWEQAIMDKVQGFGGLLLQSSAGLFLWVFGLPQAFEQLPQRAVHSALAIRQMVATAQALDLGPGPAVRLAVHLGAVQAERPAQARTGRILAVGDTIALPVRLLGQAGPWELIVSPEVGRLVEGWVALEARGDRLRTGDPAGIGSYAVMGVRSGRTALAPGGGQPRSPFVGRARELTLLDAAWEQIQAGQGQVVGLVGAPGMGKSRLLAELRQRFHAQGIRYREGQCLSYGNATPYLPVMDLVRDHCGITEGDPPEALTAKVRRALEHSGSDPAVGVPLLLDLLGVAVEADRLAGLSADVRRARTFETLGQLFLASSQQQPLVLAVENLHWIDPTSEAFLARLIEQVAGVPLLMLTTTRPGYRPPWGARSYVTQLALAPLDPEASHQVVHRVLAHRPLAPTLEEQLLAKAEGNPFFLEELAHTVREQEGPHVVLAVPDTIQAVLAARLDRLPAPEKQLV